MFNHILTLLTGAGVFLIGIVMFCAELSKNTSHKMYTLFKKISGNRFAGFAVGAGATAIVQSSTATTVMVIGLVNAGILTLFQATSIIIGANVGTTLTSLLISLSAFPIKYLFMSFAFLGAFLRVSIKKENVRKVADLLISFGLLFVGLELMSKALSESNDIKRFFSELFVKFNFPLLLILLGTLFTAVVQSSAAAMAVFIGLIALPDSPLSIESALFLVLGANIGTCLTTIIASFTANVNAKRAALIHLLFSVIGAIVYTAILWPLEDRVVSFYDRIVPDPVWQLSVFHVIFNVTTAMLLIWFINPLNRLACRLIKDKPETDTVLKTKYIDDVLLGTPALAVEQLKKEIKNMADTARDNLNAAFEAMIKQELGGKDKLNSDEEYIDFLNRAIARFIIKLTSGSLTDDEAALIGSYHHVINDLERIGDYAVKMFKEADRMKKYNYKLSRRAVAELKAMLSKVMELFTAVMVIFDDRNPERLRDIVELNRDIDQMRLHLADVHLQWLKGGQYNQSGGEYFYSVISDLERIADHLTNIAMTTQAFAETPSENYQLIEFEEIE